MALNQSINCSCSTWKPVPDVIPIITDDPGQADLFNLVQLFLGENTWSLIPKPAFEALYSAYKSDAIQYKWPMIGHYTDYITIDILIDQW